VPNPIDLQLTMANHPDAIEPLSDSEAFGIRVRRNTPTQTDRREGLGEWLRIGLGWTEGLEKGETK